MRSSLNSHHPESAIQAMSVVEGKLGRPFPLIERHEGAGRVLECGSDVRDLKPGDHVVCSVLQEWAVPD
jgi:Zn-dependent alcohol dehydrogenase